MFPVSRRRHRLGYILPLFLIASGCASDPAQALQVTPAAEAPSASAPAAEAPPIPTVASIEGIGPVGEWRKLGGDYVLSEGPAANAKGDVFFTDFRGGGIYRVEAGSSEVTMFMKDVNAGGVAFDRSGDMIVLEGKNGQVLKVDPVTRAARVISAGLDGARYNAPNDLVLDRNGGFYFSDPSQGAPLPLPQGKQSIFYASANGRVRRVIDYIPRPNGLALSRDQKSLYVALSGDTQILKYAIERPGVVNASSRVFAETAFQPPLRRGEGAVTGVDGLKTDSLGNVYAASRFGIEVFSPQGKPLGIIAVPERPSNLTFGGRDMKTLFVTTYRSFYAVDMAVRGKSPAE